MMSNIFDLEGEKPWLLRQAWSITWALTFIFHGAAVGLLYWFVQSRDDLVILRYNAYLGIDLLGVWWQLFLMPALTFLFVLINLLLAKLLFSRGYPGVATLFMLGSILLSGSVVVVAATLAFINI